MVSSPANIQFSVGLLHSAVPVPCCDLSSQDTFDDSHVESFLNDGGEPLLPPQMVEELSGSGSENVSMCGLGKVLSDVDTKILKATDSLDFCSVDLEWGVGMVH